MVALSRSISLPMRKSDANSASSRTYKARFRWSFLRGIPLPLPIWPAFVLFCVLAVGSSTSRVLPPAGVEFSPWSNAEIAAWMVSKPPPTCSFCLFLKRRIWVFEYGDFTDWTPVVAMCKYLYRVRFTNTCYQWMPDVLGAVSLSLLYDSAVLLALSWIVIYLYPSSQML